MAFLGNLMAATGNAISAFRETMLHADPQQGRAGMAFDPGSWDRWEARQVRYDLYWSLYQNNAYRDLVHPWAARFKTSYGAYKHVRHLYNPAYRLGEFWAGHLMGGTLDRDAGDGESVPSALPILADRDAIRPGIARLWKASRWQVAKDHYARWGAVLGDVALKGVHDPARGEVRMEVEHPGHLKWVDRDASGEVRAYILQKWIVDPRDAGIRDASPTVDPMARQRRVLYYEKCYLDGDDTVWETYLDGEPHAPDGGEPVTRRPYGFVPLEVAGHEAIGMDWAQNCFHAGLSRFLEVDDQASCLGDQARRLLKAPMLIAGANGLGTGAAPGGADRATRSPEQNLANPEPSRTETPFRYSTSPDTKAYPLYADMDLKGVVEHIRSLQSDVEMNYPELLADTGNLGGNVTAEAIRNARQRASGKVQARRPGYEDPLARLQAKLLAMGGHEGCDGYRGLSLDDYRAGRLGHAIGHRSVFDVNPMDQLEEDSAFYRNAIAARTAGVPLPLFLARNGWSVADLAELKAAQALEPQPTTTINLGQTGQGADNGGELI